MTDIAIDEAWEQALLKNTSITSFTLKSPASMYGLGEKMLFALKKRKVNHF
jgi:hypothetical protein